jgi:SAM-dependent methyltransferase
LIEHVEDYVAVMEEMHRVLKLGGTLILSTPNKDVTSPGRKTPIHDFHVHEFTIPELRDLCQRYFAEVELFSQENPFEKSRRVVRWLMALDFLRLRKLFSRRAKDQMKDRMREKMGEAINKVPEPERWAVIPGARRTCRDIVVVCRKAR